MNNEMTWGCRVKVKDPSPQPSPTCLRQGFGRQVRLEREDARTRSAVGWRVGNGANVLEDGGTRL